MPEWKQRPSGSAWGEFGRDDQFGRMNLLTPERRRAAIAEAREGIVFMLSLPLDCPGGAGLWDMRQPPKLSARRYEDGTWNYNWPVAHHIPHATDVVSDDAVLLYLQHSTQWDSLAHVGERFDADADGVAEPVYYNGFRAGEHVIGADQPDGPYARALGIENLAVTGAQGRGVLVNLYEKFGNDRVRVGYDELQRLMEAQHVEVETGDFLCLYTGYADLMLGMKDSPDRRVLHTSSAGLDGDDARLLRWVSDTGLVAICADNLAVENVDNWGAPSADGCQCSVMPLHEHCLFKLGVHLGELWYFRDLAAWLKANGRTRFLLTAPPLRLPGAVGSPVTPIATV